ncbi:adenylate kinase isoenzyme 6 [Cyclospora cayetanensis]|uniref:Adenylate kinase isoenzyme 6 n=2 Tax=Cyclospora cayetanensis TaxID=88456 RepID=A0A6P5WDP6_9EIME|nr:adenylate kinase isoenzyme 6 [Cyclospora cayetanensis]OEH78643.1 taf9 RNA polymerase tata box binding protein-associated factor isoform 2 family protein [Cyclospora cayetanensis]
MQRRPNILVTGTPGVGKTTFCQQLAEDLDLEHINVGKLISDESLFQEWDDELKCSIFDEDKVADRLNELLSSGGKLVDFHSCDFMEPSWFALVFVLRAETHIIYDRLAARHYSESKIQENVQSEIFQVLLDEATETFGEEKVTQLQSNVMDDLTTNIAVATQKYQAALGVACGQ